MKTSLFAVGRMPGVGRLILAATALVLAQQYRSPQRFGNALQRTLIAYHERTGVVIS